jgi:RNA polymerase sigma-70 factor (ECF subfamily)
MDLPMPLTAPALAEDLFLAELQAQAPAIQALACRMLGDPGDAADAVQETWIRAWTARADLRDGQALRPWLRRIAARECLRILRWRTVRRWLPGSQSLPEIPVSGPNPVAGLDAARVRAAAERLPARQRQVWGLRFDEGWTIPEIASSTGLSPETVKTCLSRALETVRRTLECTHV